MPLRTETDPPRKRRLPVALAILAVVVLPLVALFAWSLYSPITVGESPRQVTFGHYPDSALGPTKTNSAGYASDSTRGYRWVTFKLWAMRPGELPGGSREWWYAVAWSWQ